MSHRDAYRLLQIRPEQAAALAAEGALIEARNGAGKAGLTRVSVDAYLAQCGPGNAPAASAGVRKATKRGLWEGLMDGVLGSILGKD